VQRDGRHVRESAGRSFRATTPPFMTNRTRCISLMSASGSPVTAIRSAYFPFSMLPI